MVSPPTVRAAISQVRPVQSLRREAMIEIDRRKRSEERAQIEADPFVMSVLEAFPGAKIGEIKTVAAPVELPVIPDEATEED